MPAVAPCRSAGRGLGERCGVVSLPGPSGCPSRRRPRVSSPARHRRKLPCALCARIWSVFDRKYTRYFIAATDEANGATGECSSGCEDHHGRFGRLLPALRAMTILQARHPPPYGAAPAGGADAAGTRRLTALGGLGIPSLNAAPSCLGPPPSCHANPLGISLHRSHKLNKCPIWHQRASDRIQPTGRGEMTVAGIRIRRGRRGRNGRRRSRRRPGGALPRHRRWHHPARRRPRRPDRRHRRLGPGPAFSCR